MTFSVWLKSNTSSTQSIQIMVVGDISNSTTCQVLTTWQRCSVTISQSSPAGWVGVLNDNYHSQQWDISIWGAQVETAPSVGLYVATTGSPTTGASGIAILQTAGLANGSRSLTAAYSGDDNNSPSSSAPLTQEVDLIAITTFQPLSSALVSSSYTATLNAVGGTPPYSWTVIGSLPDGLSLDSNSGTISGVPTGNDNGQPVEFNVQATDSSDQPNTVTKEYVIEVLSPDMCPSRPVGGPKCTLGSGIYGIYSDQGHAGTTGLTFTVYGCFANDHSDLGTITLNYPPGFTQTAPLSFTEGNALQITTTVNIASDAPTGAGVLSANQDLDGCQQKTNVLPYYVIPGPRFDIAYSSYIPVDHIEGPTGCFYGDTPVLHKLYQGDANQGTYRTTESLVVDPEAQRELSRLFKNTGITSNYGFRSPVNGETLSWLDKDEISDDCYLWNKSGQASFDAFSYNTSYPFPHQAQVQYSGSASNPLESSLSSITWDVRTVIDTTNPAAPTAYVNFNHTCYPAHQVKINGQVVYLYTPAENDLIYIFDCLVLHDNKVTGQTEPTQVPLQ